MAKGQRSQIAMTDLGPEKLCTKCDEWWPDDSEFFYLTHGVTIQPCKACYEQLPSVIRKREKQRKQKKPAGRGGPALMSSQGERNG